MIDILNSIIQTVTGAIGFLTHTITTLLSFLVHIPVYVSFITSSVAFLPAIFIPFCVASISIWVMLFLINR